MYSALEKAPHLFLYDFMNEPIKIRGLSLTAKIDAVLIKANDGQIELDSFDMGDIYLFCEELPNNLLLIDQTNLKSRNRELYYEFIRRAEKMAIEKGKDGEWINGY